MLIEDVKKLSPLDRFVYWVRERWQVYKRRQAGKPKPWTDDEILQNYFFTMPYRELDKTTVWFRENIRDRLRDNAEVIFATVCFRWFNYIPTGELLVLGGYLDAWHRGDVVRQFSKRRAQGEQLFTGAFMVNSPGGEPKLEAICRRVDAVWKDRKSLIEDAQDWKTLQQAHQRLTVYDGLGGFMAYEIVCDLRYTKWLENATDKMTWCNPGPGAVRGLCRLLGIDFPKGRNAHGFTPKVPIDKLEEMCKLLATMQRRLPKMLGFELREAEHSLCEWDKYERLLWNDGRSKRRYKGI